MDDSLMVYFILFLILTGGFIFFMMYLKITSSDNGEGNKNSVSIFVLKGIPELANSIAIFEISDHISIKIGLEKLSGFHQTIIPFDKVISAKRYSKTITVDKSNMTGAAIGGILAGTTGAIIGASGKGSKQVDVIYLEIHYYNGEKENIITICNQIDHSYYAMKIEGVIKQLEVNSKFYNCPINVQYIEQYDSDIFRVENTTFSPKQTEINTIEQIKELGSLMNQGLLTENEFNEKKKELLTRL